MCKTCGFDDGVQDASPVGCEGFFDLYVTADRFAVAATLLGLLIP